MKSIIVGGVVLGLLVKTGSAAMTGSFLLGSGGDETNVGSNNDVGVVARTPTLGSRWR